MECVQDARLESNQTKCCLVNGKPINNPTVESLLLTNSGLQWQSCSTSSQVNCSMPGVHFSFTIEVQEITEFSAFLDAHSRHHPMVCLSTWILCNSRRAFPNGWCESWASPLRRRRASRCQPHGWEHWQHATGGSRVSVLQRAQHFL